MNLNRGINLAGKDPSKFLRSRFLMPAVFLSACVIGIMAVYIYFSKDLPDLRDLTRYQPVILNEFYSSEGELIAQSGLERRALVNLESIPSYLVNAFIAVEDRRFYQHSGVDAKSVVRALYQNLVTGRIVSGGSTITQQITKNLILGPQKAYTRKIKEAILSYRIERNLSKDEILYLYLNHIYLADGVYGVEMASRNYFGKSARDINIAEACLLAGIPRRPEQYSPRTNLSNALKRQKTVINIMREQEFITPRQQREALAYKIKVIPKQEPRGEYVAPYFIEYVREYLEKRVGRKAYEKGGYKVYTTLDMDLNLAAYRAVRRGIRNLEKRQGRTRFTIARLRTAEKIEEFKTQQKNLVLQNGKTYRAVVTVIGDIDERTSFATVEVGGKKQKFSYMVDSERYLPPPEGRYLLPEKLHIGDVVKVRVFMSGEKVADIVPLFRPRVQGALLSMDTRGNVISMVGGYDFGLSKFNRATQAKRQPGSAFKPFLYSAAIDKGYTQTSKLLDVPIIVDDWIPENYDEEYMGSIFFRESLVNSRNLSSIRLIMDIDPEYVAGYSRHFGFKSRIGPYPSLALGSSEVTLLELTTAYSVFANSGIYRQPNFILRIYDRNGSLIEDNTGEVYLRYEKKLKQKKEKKDGDASEEWSYRERVSPESQEGRLQFLGLFAEEQRDFLTSEEFRFLIKKVPIHYFGEAGGFDRVISPETAYIMTDIMKAVISEGTGLLSNPLNSKARIAGKTGTTNDYTDAWFIGYSPMVVTGVWVGKDDNTSLGDKESGSLAAVPVWKEFMSKALDKYNDRTEFEVPSGVRIMNTPLGKIPYKVKATMSKDEVLSGLRMMVGSQEEKTGELEDYDYRIDSLFRGDEEDDDE
ncbi:MAG: PBP1A family penicillin-binding protein [Candidatus Dadabacteria bacterium]|nr:PBP1A family penicillin-binding protein [Candidatus Dadabacteria bacterium]